MAANRSASYAANSCLCKEQFRGPKKRGPVETGPTVLVAIATSTLILVRTKYEGTFALVILSL